MRHSYEKFAIKDRHDRSRVLTLSPMAMGKRQRHAKQASMWVATQDLPRNAAHPFYARLNHILDRHDFDPDAKITKMKDGRTHLAHKAEHAVDLETGFDSPGRRT